MKEKPAMKEKKIRVERTHCGGRWTSARFRSFIVSALRSASVRWAPREEAIKAAYVRQGLNPKTGKKCKLHKCAMCGELHPKHNMRADHIDPVVDPRTGFTTWDDFISRMFAEVDGYQALCNECHDQKTAEERKLRSLLKKKKTQKPQKPRPRRV